MYLSENYGKHKTGLRDKPEFLYGANFLKAALTWLVSVTEQLLNLQQMEATQRPLRTGFTVQ